MMVYIIERNNDGGKVWKPLYGISYFVHEENAAKRAEDMNSAPTRWTYRAAAYERKKSAL